MAATTPKNESSPFFSVIVPAYNVKAYLGQCVESVLSQTFGDFELFLVDDGSQDGSGAVCDACAQRDRRVTVLHKKTNEGPGAARNSALDLCAGEYVLFVDGDDFLSDDAMFERIADTATRRDADVILYSYKKFYDADGTFGERIIGSLPEECDRRRMIAVNAYKALVWNKAVKRSLIEKARLRFAEGVLASEDLRWCAHFLLAAKRIAFCDVDSYAYRQRGESSTGSKNQDIRKRCLWDALNEMEACAAQYGVDGTMGKDADIIGAYLAYEYAWTLGKAFPFWSDCAKKARELSFLLNYRLSEKAAKVRTLSRIFGLRTASFLLYAYVSLRPRRLLTVKRIL